MARKSRGRTRNRARKARGRHVASGLFGFAWLAQSGWGRFAFGILIGIALGVGAAFYLGGVDLSPRRTGPVTVATLNATPVQRPAQAAAPKPASLQIVEP